MKFLILTWTVPAAWQRYPMIIGVGGRYSEQAIALRCCNEAALHARVLVHVIIYGRVDCALAPVHTHSTKAKTFIHISFDDMIVSVRTLFFLPIDFFSNCSSTHPILKIVKFLNI